MTKAACCYCCVERPGIDARVMFKHKVEIEKIKAKRIAYLKSQHIES